jgi:hypothetical protein
VLNHQDARHACAGWLSQMIRYELQPVADQDDEYGYHNVLDHCLAWWQVRVPGDELARKQ